MQSSKGSLQAHKGEYLNAFLKEPQNFTGELHFGDMHTDNKELVEGRSVNRMRAEGLRLEAGPFVLF